jgi:hypothetical protein
VEGLQEALKGVNQLLAKMPDNVNFQQVRAWLMDECHAAGRKHGGEGESPRHLWGCLSRS